MRGLILLVTILGALGVSIRYPYVGVMTWVWVSVMSPQDNIYNFQNLPLNLIIAVLALATWLIFSREPKAMRGGLTAIIFYLLFLWMTFNQFFFGADLDYSLTFWDRCWKTFLMGAVVGALTLNKVRFQALMWVIALSLGFWGVKGGIFTLASGGGAHALGPGSSEIGDNNTFALVIVALIPMLFYLYLQSANRAVRYGLLAAIVLCIVCALGSQSRGGFVALAVLGAAFWLRARNKLVYAIAVPIILLPILHFMPESFWERMHTINSYESDVSFQERVAAWMVAWKYAVAHFPFGAGFYALQLPSIYHQYSPDTIAHAAHSIYFQILGEDGFGGLAIYLLLIASTFNDYRVIIARTKRGGELRWANDLARMLQLSLLAYCVGGAALSLAYYDQFVLLVWIAIALRKFTAPERERLPVTRDVYVPAAVPASSPLGRSPLEKGA